MSRIYECDGCHKQSPNYLFVKLLALREGFGYDGARLWESELCADCRRAVTNQALAAIQTAVQEL